MNGAGLPVCWAACDGPTNDFSTDGQSMVTLGGMNDPSGYIGQRMAYDAKMARLPSPGSAVNLPPATVEALLRLVRTFTELSRTQVLYLHARLNGKNGMEASRSLGITKQAGQQMGARIARRFPELRAFFYARRAQGGGRRRGDGRDRA